ncbi:MAG: peptidoglycan-binding protein [Acidimicrobiia bacterium]|nr:peptidoglycan-binding protein [Acidimicrobiia bacterium]
MLRNGSQGDEVMALQKSLMAMGMNPGTPDGIFGPKTEAAVKQAQERGGVTADGIWGPASQAAFDEMKAKMSGAGLEKEESSGGIQDMLKSSKEAAADAAPDLPDFA